MTRREQLLEQYEEALFALLMEENAPAWDEELEKELAALEQDPAAQVSPEADRRSLDTIRHALEQETHKEQRSRAPRGRLRPLLMAACLALVFLAGGIFGPELAREGALAPLLAGIGIGQPQRPLELTPGWLPEGWAFVYSTTTRDRAVAVYTDGGEGILTLELCAPPGAPTVAVASTQGAETVEVQGCQAALVQAGDRLELSWRTEQDERVGIGAAGLGREDLLTLAEELKY